MKILIIEDEASIMDRLLRLTHSILGCRIKSIDTAFRVSEARSHLNTKHYDLLLLDLNLSGKDGFDLLKELSTRTFHTIVVSAHVDRAIEAYELGVLDFVKKPFDEERLSKAFERILKPDTLQTHFAKYLAIRNSGRVDLIPLEEIDYIQADGPCSLICKSDGSLKSHDKMLKGLQLILPDYFERVHKSYLANLKRAIGLERSPHHKHRIRFNSGAEIPVSRPYAKKLYERFTLKT